MTIRPLDLRDLPHLYRLRSDTISLDSARTLTLNKASGSYPGMPARIHVRLVVVGENHGAGAEGSKLFDGEAVYQGKALRLTAS